MKLKAGGKAIVIAAVVVVIGAVANQFGVFEKKAKPPVVAIDDDIDVPPPVVTKLPHRELADEPVRVQEQPVASPKQDASANRGMAAVLAAGKKE